MTKEMKVTREMKLVENLMVRNIADATKNAILLLCMVCLASFVCDNKAHGQHRMDVLGSSFGGFSGLFKEVSNRTSIDVSSTSEKTINSLDSIDQSYWLWTKGTSRITNERGEFSKKISFWIKKGGFLVIQGKYSKYQLDILTSGDFSLERKEGVWKAVAPDHELLRSFYLLDSLPSCQNELWYEFRYDGRTSVVVIPDEFAGALADNSSVTCAAFQQKEQLVRTFINISMVALTTDYKKDQIHIPEILKRLR